MEIEKDIQLASFTTLGIGGPAEFFVVAKNVNELRQALQFAHDKNLPVFILGGGSNILVSDSGVEGLIIKIEFKGIEVLEENEQIVRLKVAAGEAWDVVIKYAVDNGLWGIENLSHIPGNTGAIAVQNVGAYGQEASQVVEAVEILDTRGILVSHKDSPCVTRYNSDCQFAYRSSIFNTAEKGKHIITSVTLNLSKVPKPNLAYGDVKKYFNDRNIENPSLKQISQAIIEIRDRKFPYPGPIGNGSAGSFFKAHTISHQEYKILIKKVSDTFFTEAGDRLVVILDRLTVAQGVKVPYGYLIELCGLKGYQMGGAKVCQTHSGVLLNSTGTAAAKDVLDLFKHVRQTVYGRTGIILENEPELAGFSETELQYYFQLE